MESWYISLDSVKQAMKLGTIPYNLDTCNLVFGVCGETCPRQRVLEVSCSIFTANENVKEFYFLQGRIITLIHSMNPSIFSFNSFINEGCSKRFKGESKEQKHSQAIKNAEINLLNVKLGDIHWAIITCISNRHNLHFYGQNSFPWSVVWIIK